jgi:hypothetical protein
MVNPVSADRARLRKESVPSANRRSNPIGVAVQPSGWPSVLRMPFMLSVLHAVANSSCSKSYVSGRPTLVRNLRPTGGMIGIPGKQSL